MRLGEMRWGSFTPMTWVTNGLPCTNPRSSMSPRTTNSPALPWLPAPDINRVGWAPMATQNKALMYTGQVIGGQTSMWGWRVMGWGIFQNEAQVAGDGQALAPACQLGGAAITPPIWDTPRYDTGAVT